MMTVQSIALLVILALAVAAVAFIVAKPEYLAGFKYGMKRAKINRLVRKQQKCTLERHKIKAKAKKIQEKLESLES